METLFDFDWWQALLHFYLLAVALILSLPIALNREYYACGAGLRTFPLVAVASCAYMLVGMQVYGGSEPEARVMYGIITGIGFIGGGAILKGNNNIMGTATAASIWNTAAIGVSVAYHRFEIAVILSVVNFIILQFAEPLKRRDRENDNNIIRTDQQNST